jgi:hypothetical protein
MVRLELVSYIYVVKELIVNIILYSKNVAVGLLYVDIGLHDRTTVSLCFRSLLPTIIAFYFPTWSSYPLHNPSPKSQPPIPYQHTTKSTNYNGETADITKAKEISIQTSGQPQQMETKSKSKPNPKSTRARQMVANRVKEKRITKKFRHPHLAWKTHRGGNKDDHTTMEERSQKAVESPQRAATDPRGVAIRPTRGRERTRRIEAQSSRR